MKVTIIRRVKRAKWRAPTLTGYRWGEWVEVGFRYYVVTYPYLTKKQR